MLVGYYSRFQAKNRSMKYLLLSIFFLYTILLSAQNELPIGHWRSHLPYVVGDYVTQSPTKVIYSTTYSLILFDKEELSTEFISKVEGLSGVSIRFVKYNPLSNIIMIFYEDSVIDLIKEEEDGSRTISTLQQIANFNNFTGEKKLNNVFIEDESNIYIAANYGISKINLDANEFAFTTFTGIGVRDIAVFEGNIYAATAEGIYRASVSNPFLEDFGNWTLLGSSEGFPEVYSSKAVEVFDDYLYIDIDDEQLYRLKGNDLDLFWEESGKTITFLDSNPNHLFVGYPVCTSNGCSGGKILYIDANDNVGDLASGCFFSVSSVVEDEQGRVWLGEIGRDFRRYDRVDSNDCDQITVNSPYSAENREMTVANNQLWLASGGLNQTLSARFLAHGFASLIDGQWTIYNRNTWDVLKGEDPNSTSDDLYDFVTIKVHPENGTIYAGSFLEGLIEFDGETMNLYNEKNSTLDNADGDSPRSRVSGLTFDDDNNLWISNHLAKNLKPISVLKPGGEFQSFSLPGCGTQNQIFQIAVDQNSFKWAVIGTSSAGVLAFDSGDMDDPNDDRCRIFNASNSNLPTNNTNCLEVDLDGDVWVGTTEGVVIFECGGSVFDNACQGSRRIVEQDGFNAFLLETEDVSTIAVDGANRKWIGTKNGVFVLSPSGEEEIARFTTENSPLFDNTIIDIAINPDNGEVFIGTNRGVQSYQADAILGGRVNKSPITVFPNPVRPEYTGPIAMKGFARDANVKITDINGKLVYETTALGGQAIWDGRDYNGRRANSGVYLIFGTTNPRNSGFEDPDAVVGKILFIN